MWRLMGLARGWGTKGSGLVLLQCVTMDDSDMMMEEGGMGIRRSRRRRESSPFGNVRGRFPSIVTARRRRRSIMGASFHCM